MCSLVCLPCTLNMYNFTHVLEKENTQIIDLFYIHGKESALEIKWLHIDTLLTSKSVEKINLNNFRYALFLIKQRQTTNAQP